MKFLLEDSYPRVWCQFNGEPSKKTHTATTLQQYVKPRYWKGTSDSSFYKGRQARVTEIQPKLLSALRSRPMTMPELVRTLEKSPSGVASGIKALREKGYIIECRASTYHLIE